MTDIRFTTHFYGNEISDYGKQNGYVDYRCFAKAFDGVLNNEIMLTLGNNGFYFEPVNGFGYYYEDSDGNRYTEDEKEEKIEELEARIDELETIKADTEDDREYMNADSEIDRINEEIDTLNEEHEENGEIFQYYIVDDNGANLIQEYTTDPLFYCEAVDMYIWGVTHYGTSWDYVLTDIKCEKCEA